MIFVNRAVELAQKRKALNDLSSALARGGNDFTLILSDDGNTVTLIDHGGAEKQVNVRMDSLGAMLRDVLNRAGDWIY